MRGEEKCKQDFGGETQKRLLGRPEDNIKIDLKEIEWGVDWIYVAQDRDTWWAVLNKVMKFWVP